MWEAAMKISEVMTREVRVANPEETIQEAAGTMAELDMGFLPVGTDERLVGTITDRDIAVRGVAKGRGPNVKVQEVMSTDVKYCFEDEEVDHVLDNMGEIQVRRLPVVDRNKRLVGVVSLGDLANKSNRTDEALAGISRRGGKHSQAA
jgi:CBS domain-containing protein